MRYLLDSNVFLMALAAPEKLRPGARHLLSSERGTLYLSAATSWEMSIKYAIGRLKLPEAPRTYVPAWLQTWGIHTLDVTHPHAFGVGDLPLHHHDPFDRLLIAQAKVENMTLLTTDRVFKKYPINVYLCGV